MADDNVIVGGDGSGDNNEPSGHDAEKERSKAAKEQANAMWGEINKGVAKDEREDLKGEVAVDSPVNPFESVPGGKEVTDGVGDGAIDEPINPFADAVIPPQKPVESKEEGDVVAKNPFDHPKPVHEEVKTSEHKPLEHKPHAQEVENQDAENTPEDEEVVEAEVVNVPFDPGSPSVDIEEDEDKAEFWQILQQAGVTKKTIVNGLIVLGVFILFVMSFLFGWWDIFSFSGGSDSKEVVQDEEQQQEEVVSDEVTDDSGEDFYSVISSYVVGLEYRPLDGVVPLGQWGTFAPLETAFVVGLDIRKQQAAVFVEYTDLLRKLENAFNTDVYALLDLAVEDRRGALEEHITDLEKLIIEGESAVLDLDGELISLNNEYNVVLQERDTLEANFFTQMELMQGEAAYQNLLSFTELSKETVEMRAQFNGRSILQEMLNNVLDVLVPRLEDIKANREALIRGIRVFDIPGSNIDTIVPVE